MSRPLEELQREMAAYLRAPGEVPAPAGVEPRRLKIYEDLVYRNIEGFINSGFPVLRSLYDEQRWAELLRAFIREHRCKTPLFLRISEEFLAFLHTRPDGQLRPFERELAHYEWLELAVDVAEGELPDAWDSNLPLASGELQACIAATARLGSYQYPVHRIGPSFQPETASDPSFLLVYRDREERVQFMELSAGSARLLGEVASAVDPSVQDLLARLADLWGMDPTQLAEFGEQQLREFNAAGICGFTPCG